MIKEFKDFIAKGNVMDRPLDLSLVPPSQQL